MSFYVYMLASRRNGTIYVGQTDDLTRRIWEHKSGAIPGFTSRYGVKTLVWFEQFETREAAFACERVIKRWNRIWKIGMIEASNLWWRDLYEDFQP